jgi:hypothetical protein
VIRELENTGWKKMTSQQALASFSSLDSFVPGSVLKNWDWLRLQ